ncbi:MAG: proline/betaine transporter [Candidatus Tokpelaia sp. JSC085]|nr:MAG: proline/betaine transporter [Candidatus Tokpelaia sp. JSC085]
MNQKKGHALNKVKLIDRLDTKDHSQVCVGPKTSREKTKLIVAASLGNFLEFFDFTVYSFFAEVIGQIFFKNDDPMVSLMFSATVFGVGFLMRPFGSIMIGTYADRHGRKAAMLITIAIMAFGSAMIGFAPPYSSIGMTAPVLIVIGRLLQGFSAGGEIGAATTLLMESAPHSQRGLFISWQFVGQGLSSMCGALFGAVLSYMLSEEQLLTWGWRVPFFFSLLIIPVGLYIRSHVGETYSGENHSITSKAFSPVIKIIREDFSQFVLATLMIMPVTLLIYIMVFYMPTYLKQTTDVMSSYAYFLSAGMSIMTVISALLGGVICDRIPQRKPFAILILFITLVSSFIVFYMASVIVIFVIALMVCVAALGMLMTVQALLVTEAFPRGVRATAISVSYSLGVTVFGGTAQMVVVKLMAASGSHPMSPFWYLGTMLILGILAYALFREVRYV